MQKLIKVFWGLLANDICPKCGEQKFWEGYCENCGYNNNGE